MRLSQIFFKHNARSPQNPDKVPFKEVMPLKLRNRVAGGTTKTLEGKCLYEMSLVFACWKNSNFEPNKCHNEVQNFYGCYNRYMKDAALEKEFKKISVPSPDTKVFTKNQITYLLQKYPTV
ncbi:hypothetical protein QLX08_007330 [Tetragonisca angustula]|uniref:Coiled-coil-helix-coiled-coil-helix domain-containing protein 1 n=1 Tax=Tetragonisca angustula TaxID=166442 RepID=A0AAW0ZQ11_9HYME